MLLKVVASLECYQHFQQHPYVSVRHFSPTSIRINLVVEFEINEWLKYYLNVCFRIYVCIHINVMVDLVDSYLLNNVYYYSKSNFNILVLEFQATWAAYTLYNCMCSDLCKL